MKRYTVFCPDCGSMMRLITARNRFYPNGQHRKYYGCILFPHCKGTVPAKPDGEPNAFLPTNDLETIEWRDKAHYSFDKLWRGPKARMTRQAAYSWLARVMKKPKTEAHIGAFTKEECQQVIRLIQQTFKIKKKRKAK